MAMSDSAKVKNVFGEEVTAFSNPLWFNVLSNAQQRARDSARTASNRSRKDTKA